MKTTFQLDRFSVKTFFRSIQSKVLDELTINITNQCNLDCKYCFVGSSKYGQNSPCVKSILNSIGNICSAYEKVKSIKIFGGEPFLYPDEIDEIITTIKDWKIKGTINYSPPFKINTNATIFNEKIGKLIKNNSISITASIDGPAKVHDIARKDRIGKGTFKTVDKNIRRMRKFFKQPQSFEIVYHPGHIKHGFSMSDIDRFIQKRYNPLNIFQHPIMDYGTLDCMGWNKEDFTRYSEKMYQISYDYGKYLVELHAINKSKKRVAMLLLDYNKSYFFNNQICFAGIERWSIAPNGDIYPCYVMIGDPSWRISAGKEFCLEKGIPAKMPFYNLRCKTGKCQECSIYDECYDCLYARSKGAGNIIYCDYKKGILDGIKKYL